MFIIPIPFEVRKQTNIDRLKRMIDRAALKGMDVDGYRLERNSDIDIVPPEIVAYAKEKGVDIVYHV